MGACGSTTAAAAAQPPGKRQSLASPDGARPPGALLDVLAAIFYRFSTLGVGLVAALLALAVIPAPIIYTARGGELEFAQTISASVADWHSPEGRLFFALCTFAAVLNLLTLHTFLLTPPSSASLPLLCRAVCCRACEGRCTCCAPTSSLPRGQWILGQQGALRFFWLTLQSLGLHLLASCSYTLDPPASGGGAAKLAAGADDGVEATVHNVGAALAFVVSLGFELAVLLHNRPAPKSASATHMTHTGRLVCTSLGVACALLFQATQYIGCSGFAPPDICPPPWGVVSYTSECAMCLCLSADFFFTAFEHRNEAWEDVWLALEAGDDARRQPPEAQAPPAARRTLF